jgi:hypothetical protein
MRAFSISDLDVFDNETTRMNNPHCMKSWMRYASVFLTIPGKNIFRSSRRASYDALSAVKLPFSGFPGVIHPG